MNLLKIAHPIMMTSLSEVAKQAYVEPIGRSDRVTVGGVSWRMGRRGLMRFA